MVRGRKCREGEGIESEQSKKVLADHALQSSFEKEEQVVKVIEIFKNLCINGGLGKILGLQPSQAPPVAQSLKASCFRKRYHGIQCTENR